MTFMDSINDAMNTTIFGIPVIAIIAGLLILLFLVWKFKPKEGRKRLNLAKEVRKDFDEMYRMFGEATNKKLNAGFIRVGYALGQFPLYWDKNLPSKKNLRASQQLKNAVKKAPEIEELTAFRMCKNNLLDRGLAKLGFKITYILIPSDKIDLGEKEISFPSSLQPQEFLGVYITSKTSRDYVENIAFKLNREEELTEIADFIPKQNYLEVSTATDVAKARERAKIEKEKYKGQIEGAEEV